MNVNQKNIQSADEEFDFSQIFIALWKYKVSILCCIIITTILTGIYSIFIISPVYSSNLNIVMNMPENYTTEYGDYTLPITTNQQYMNFLTSNTVIANTIKELDDTKNNVTIDDIRDKISIIDNNTNADVKQNYFKVIVSSNSPDNALKLATTLYNNYIEFIDIITMENIAKYFTEYYTTNINQLNYYIESSTELLKKNEELLSKTPKTINHNEAVNDIKDVVGTKDIIILDDVTNPNYTELEKDIIEIKQNLFSYNNQINTNKKYLEKLALEKKAINEYYLTGELDTELMKSSIVASSISLPSAPVAPSRKDSPSNAKNIIIGMLAGIIIGCIVALIKNFWSKWKLLLN